MCCTSHSAAALNYIEQGPILEDNAKSIGVVSGGQAIRWLDVRVEGMAAHAGTTPMPLRKDALYGVAQMIQAIEGLAADFAHDLRHHRDETIEAMEQQAVDALGYAQQSMVSGAGHDAIHLARYCPTAMVFIPCVGGLSHNEAEDVLPEDVRQGTDVLLNAVLARAEKID
ncbi:N-carbamoyl-L-amino-acid hydrolase [Pseudomonas fluorescens]|nr:N-carbamoyl-L-amino-acid hydrolase [Pseudomonas fluorescens]VVN81904.1 N-carbamoyl-L-amino-acid hydrolase [Pseudomonas fluorescens]